MKKKVAIIVFFLLIIVVLSWKIVDTNRRKNYYQKLKDNMQNDITRVLHLVHPYCEVSNAAFVMTFEEEQNDYYGIDKKKLLDIDGISYCKVRIKAKCVATNQLSWDTYIKCKNYEDDMYSIEK